MIFETYREWLTDLPQKDKHFLLAVLNTAIFSGDSPSAIAHNFFPDYLEPNLGAFLDEVESDQTELFWGINLITASLAIPVKDKPVRFS